MNVPLTTIAVAGVRPADAGAASGLTTSAKQVGGALGLAVLVAVAGVRTGSPEAVAAGNGRAFVGIALVLALVAAGALALPRRG